MDKKNSITLSKYRFEQAKENIEEAELLFKESKYKGASNEHIIAYFMQ